MSRASLPLLVVSKPIDVPTRETAAFISSRLSPGASVLEVGYGLGHVASELERVGHRVVGIDADPEVVAGAKARGFAAVQSLWPEFEGGPSDAVVFTRSLHHIGDLDRAIRRAREALVPGGLLLVEDFAFDEMDAKALAWFVGVLRSHAAQSLIVPLEDEFVASLLDSSDSESVWRERHEHHVLHGAAAMLSATQASFAMKEVRSAPYLYRYLVPVLPETREAAVFVEDVLGDESRLTSTGAFAPLGLRFVGVPGA